MKPISLVPTLLFSASVALIGQHACAQILAVTDNGDINDGTTWDGGSAPTAGDMNQWAISNLTVRTVTQTWEGQELILQTGGRLGTNAGGVTLTMNGDLTLDGGTIAVLNNNLPFTIDLEGNTFTLNSGELISGDQAQQSEQRDLVIADAVLAGSGTIDVKGVTLNGPDRSDVIFDDTVNMSGFTGILNAAFRTRLFLPEIAVEDASFGIEVNQFSGQLSLANNLAVTSAVISGDTLDPGTYTYDFLRAEYGSRILQGGSGVLTVVSPGDIPGDFNGDGLANIADYTVWRDNLGADESALPSGSGDGSGTVDTGDYATWKANFGSPGAVSLDSASTAVPEPTTVGLTLLACVITGAGYRAT